MLPTRAASAFHAAVHDLKVARLTRVATRRAAQGDATIKERFKDALDKHTARHLSRLHEVHSQSATAKKQDFHSTLSEQTDRHLARLQEVHMRSAS